METNSNSTAVVSDFENNTLTVSTAEQPTPAIAPAGAGGVPFTSFTLTAGSEDVTVNSITVERTGPGMDGAFDSISLTDENGEGIGDDKFFHSNHQTAFNEPFTIPARSSKTFTIVGNMAEDLTDYAGQAPIIQIDAINASAPVQGVLPIKGTAQTMNNTLVIGGAMAMLSPNDPNVSRNRYISDTGIRFSGIRITAKSQEDLTLSSITWYQGGTAANSDLANAVTVVNGVSYATEIDDRTYTSTFPSGIIIKKGETVDVYIQGDLTTTGANRTVEFHIDGSDGIALTGNTYGYGVGIAPEGNTAMEGNSVFITSDGTTDGDEGSPFFAGSVVTINGGTVTSIGKH